VRKWWGGGVVLHSRMGNKLEKERNNTTAIDTPRRAVGLPLFPLEMTQGRKIFISYQPVFVLRNWILWVVGPCG
jgi:hypothetical protein